VTRSYSGSNNNKLKCDGANKSAEPSSRRTTERARHHIKRSIGLRTAGIRFDGVTAVYDHVVLNKNGIGSHMPVVGKMHASEPTPTFERPLQAAAGLSCSKDEARRIAADVAKLPELPRMS
jgi:hypothetical protein